MTKYHKFIAAIFSIGFLILLQKLSVPLPVFRYLVPAVLLYLGILTLYNRWYLISIGKYNGWILWRPVLFFGTAFSLFNIVPGDFFRGLLLLFVVALGWLFEYFLGSFAENIALNETLIIAFGMIMSLSAYALQYFPGFQTLWLILVFVGTFLLTRSFYDFAPESSSSKMIVSLTLALFCAEIFWALTFLPFHYSASGLMLFNVYYFCLILAYAYAFNTLNVRRFQFHLMLLIVCSAFIFLLTPWRIIQ